MLNEAIKILYASKSSFRGIMACIFSLLAGILTALTPTDRPQPSQIETTILLGTKYSEKDNMQRKGHRISAAITTSFQNVLAFTIDQKVHYNMNTDAPHCKTRQTICAAHKDCYSNLICYKWTFSAHIS